MRWYDQEPDVYVAISMVELAEPEMQIEYAKYILRCLAESNNDYMIKNILALYENNEYPQNRWSDKNELTAKAFSCLKEAPKNIQKNIALSVLNYMNAICV